MPVLDLAADRLRFGLFLPPIHRIGRNPHWSLRRDLDLAVLLDHLGFDEMWVGEHHSSGAEIIASPEIFIAHAAALTRQITFGTGVVSLPYHHPFHVADRMLLLDHVTEGRAMFGVGPGQLARDARMIGMEPAHLRPRLEEGFDAVVRLLRGETVTTKTDWFTLDGAALQLAPYSDFEVCVTGTVSPSGPRLAGRYGAGLLSLAATDPTGANKLGEHWEIMQQEAAASGATVTRDAWRVVGPMHLAPTVEEAKRDCQYGLEWTYDYYKHISHMPADDTVSDADALADMYNETGRGVIGTPEMAVAQIQRLIDLSGGCGRYLLLSLEWADWAATQRSLELFADEVMPHFNGQLNPVRASHSTLTATSTTDVALTRDAQRAASDQYQKTREARPGDAS